MGKRKWFGFFIITLIVFESKNCLGIDCNSPETGDKEYDPEYIAKCRHLRPPGVQETIDLLDKGEEQIVINDAYKNVVFMLGNTGSGKSTAVQWLIGDEDELIAKETSEGDYIIEDKHARVGNSTITSQTIFPELSVDSETNTGFYDFSGFRDTRSTSHDIATSYFIKKIVDHVDSIKVVAAVSYPSVRVGGDRQDFRTLLRHLTEELTNIKKFRHSIALLVTKVDNNEKIVGQDYIPIDDQTEIESIATFLREVKSDFLRRLRTSEIKSTDYIFYKKAGILIDILLQTNGDQYRNIGIFRRPEDEGSLSSNKLLQEGRKYFRKIVLNKLEFVAVDTKDFGYTISEKSMNEVNDLKREVHKDILSEIYSIANDVNDRYTNVVEKAENNLKSVQNSTIDADLLKLQVALNIIDKGHNLLSKLVLEESNYDPLHLCTVINSTLTSLKISAKNLSNLYKQSNYLTFLEEVSGKKVENFQTWVIPFNKIVFYLNKAKTDVENGIKHLQHLNDMNIRTDIINEVQKLITLFYRKEDSYEDIQDIIDEANLVYKKLFIINDINDPQELIKYLHSVNFSNYQINLSQYICSKILEEHRHFAFLKNELNNAANYFHNSENWYIFLKKILFKLSTYEIQKDKNKCGKLLNDISDTDYDFKVAETGLKTFLTHCVGTNDIDAVKDLTINQIKYQALLKILDVTLEDHTTQECIHGGKLLIRGNFVTFSDINFSKCLTTLNTIEIFALHKVFIDSDLDKTGQKIELLIVAPKWEIIGDRKITLDGAAGKAIIPARAGNGASYGSNGDDGQAGNPGGPGGNFLGHATEIINGWRLTVSANGGNGGAGQHGGDGANGKNGELPTISQNELSHFIFSPARTDVIDEWSEKGFKVRASEGYTCLVIHKCYTYYVSGKRCQDGGNGGLGGHGGLGGNPGLVNIISKGSAVRVSALPGNSGLPGHGGTGADAGQGGGDITVREYHKFFVLKVKQWYVLESVSRTTCNAGRSPLEISRNIIEPQPPKQLNQSSVFEEFTNFLTSNLGNVIHNEYIRQIRLKQSGRDNRIDYFTSDI